MVSLGCECNLWFSMRALLSFHKILKCQLDPSSFMVLLEV